MGLSDLFHGQLLYSHDTKILLPTAMCCELADNAVTTGLHAVDRTTLQQV
jgi:hypothetical protein